MEWTDALFQLGTAVFAVTGVLAAARQNMDVMSFLIIGASSDGSSNRGPRDRLRGTCACLTPLILRPPGKCDGASSFRSS